MPQPQPTLQDQARARVKQWLHSTKTTQAELCERIHKNQPWMSRYLAAEFDADLETLKAIAEAFSLSLAALLDTPTDPREAALIEAYRAASPEAREYGLNLFQYLSDLSRGKKKPRR